MKNRHLSKSISQSINKSINQMPLGLPCVLHDHKGNRSFLFGNNVFYTKSTTTECLCLHHYHSFPPLEGGL